MGTEGFCHRPVIRCLTHLSGASPAASALGGSGEPPLPFPSRRGRSGTPPRHRLLGRGGVKHPIKTPAGSGGKPWGVKQHRGGQFRTHLPSLVPQFPPGPVGKAGWGAAGIHPPSTGWFGGADPMKTTQIIPPPVPPQLPGQEFSPNPTLQPPPELGSPQIWDPLPPPSWGLRLGPPDPRGMIDGCGAVIAPRDVGQGGAGSCQHLPGGPR